LAIWLFLAVSAALFTDAVLADTPLFNRDLRARVSELKPVTGTQSIEFTAIDNRPILVTFFASWCPPCLDEFSHLNAITQKYQQTDLRIIAINVYEKWDQNDAVRMARFIDKTTPLFPAVVGNEEIRTLFGGISRIPTIYGFDRSGNLLFDFVHQRGAAKTHATFEELDHAAKLLLGSKSAAQ